MITEDNKEIVRYLVITDGVFHSQCNDVERYVTRLKEQFKRDSHINEWLTADGNRGITAGDKDMTAVVLDARNKTQFIQSIENVEQMFDTLIIISNSDDMHLSGARQIATEMNKTIYTYGYVRRTAK